MTSRYVLRLEFDGAAYCGWQKQAEDREAADRPSVQSHVEDGLRTFLRRSERVVVQGCGRTDAGVHAEEFFAHFDLDAEWGPERVEKLRHGLNCLWPAGLAATGAWAVPADFHALDSVEEKTYEYRILLRRSPPTLLRGRCLWLPIRPGYREGFDRDRLAEALRALPGEHDFTAFAAAGATTRTTVRKILSAELSAEKLGHDEGQGELLRLRFRGEGFLKQMVRNLVGTLVEIAQGKREAGDLPRLLREAAPRSEAGFCAPPEGLFLTRVRSPASIESLWTASESHEGSGG